MEDLTGKQLGPYQIVSPLGEGGMAAVYKAYQPAMERYVALKILPRHFANDPQYITRFRQEAKTLAKLQHPHILPVHDFGEADGYTYIVMPFIEGGTLADFLKGHPLPLEQIRNVISQVGMALDYAHAHGLIHRDVKPSNILMDESGNCLLTDFGLAKIVEGAANITTSGTIMGTPAYMSPEQGMGQKLDRRTDIYSLGIILYEMATGRTPYRAETPMAVVVKHINDPLPSPRSLNPELPETIELVILKALSKNRENRYQTAGELVRAIQAAIPEMPAFPVSGEAATLKTAISQKPALEHQPEGIQTAAHVEERVRSAFPWVWAMVGGVIILLAIAGGLFALFGRTAKLEPLPTPQTAATAVVLPTVSPTPVATNQPTASLPSPTPGKAALILHNNTQTTIAHVYFGTIKWGGWGGEQITTPIPPGGTYTWQLQDGSGTYDLKAEDANNQVLDQQMGVFISGTYDWYVGAKP
jgi:hypothetical protein